MAAELGKYQTLVTLVTSVSESVAAVTEVLELEKLGAANNHGETDGLTAGQVQDLKNYYSLLLQHQLQRLNR